MRLNAKLRYAAAIVAGSVWLTARVYNAMDARSARAPARTSASLA